MIWHDCSASLAGVAAASPEGDCFNSMLGVYVTCSKSAFCIQQVNAVHLGSLSRKLLALAQKRLSTPIDLAHWQGAPGSVYCLSHSYDCPVSTCSTACLSYRGYPPEDADAGISFVAYGGTATVRKCQVWALKSIWKRDFQPHEQQSVFETIYEVWACASCIPLILLCQACEQCC